jgi:hypothetical protein
LESGGGLIEYAAAVITAAKHLAIVRTIDAYSIQPPPLSNFFVVLLPTYFFIKIFFYKKTKDIDQENKL